MSEATPIPAAATDWHAWHRAYEDPTSVLSRRLIIVRDLLEAALDVAPSGDIRLLSICAGDGRDLLGVLEGHTRARDVHGVLVDLDRDLCASAAAWRDRLGLDRIQCVEGDAGLSEHYEGVLPVRVALVCGVFGNVSDEDVKGTIDALPSLVASGGTVIWTRHRRPPDLTGSIRAWFAAAGFDESAFVEVAGSSSAVGCATLREASHDPPPERLFTFVGDGTAAHC